MFIDQTIAKEIIVTLTPFIDFDINIINMDGNIIASTDSEREGTMHEGAIKLLTEKLPVMIIESNTTYSGSRMGVNLPIQYENQTIGVIGISGNPENTLKYGKILQKMVEMLIYENFDTIEKSNKESTALILVSDLISGNLNNSPIHIQTRMAQLGLKYEGPFTTFILTIHNATILSENNDTFQTESTSILKDNAIKNHILKYLTAHHILCGYSQEYYIAITNISRAKLKKLLLPLADSLYQYYHVSVSFFIGSQYNECSDIPKAYHEALLLYNQHYTNAPGLYEYDLCSLNLILHQIPKIYSQNLYSYVFKKCSEKEISDICSFVQIYFEHNGSIKSIAENTYLHKNTVQYRINKIQALTGFDVRISKDLFTLYIASLFSEKNI